MSFIKINIKLFFVYNINSLQYEYNSSRRKKYFLFLNIFAVYVYEYSKCTYLFYHNF